MRAIASASAAVLLASLLSASGARSAGGMSVPSTGSIGSSGLFLACRTTSSGTPTTDYYDQSNALKTWDCGAGSRPHKGVDVLGPSTSPGVNPVYASAPGVVWSAERGNGLGWRVVLRHGRDVGSNGRYTYTIYGHMGVCSTGASLIDPTVVPGAPVSSSQFLGYQGDDSDPSGCAGRVHVHWEVRASDTDVSNVFLATPASPDFYTDLQLTAGDPAPATSVTAPGVPPLPGPTGGPVPSGSPLPSASPVPVVTPNPFQALIDLFVQFLRLIGLPLDADAAGSSSMGPARTPVATVRSVSSATPSTTSAPDVSPTTGTPRATPSASGSPRLTSSPAPASSIAPATPSPRASSTPSPAPATPAPTRPAGERPSGGNYEWFWTGPTPSPTPEGSR